MFLCIAWFHYQSSTVLPCYVFFIQIYYSFSNCFLFESLIFSSFNLIHPLRFHEHVFVYCLVSSPKIQLSMFCFFYFFIFFHAVLANEPQSINCLYKHWTVKNNYLTDLHFINLARISCWPALTEIHYRWSAVWIVTWHEMLVENILLNNSWGSLRFGEHHTSTLQPGVCDSENWQTTEGIGVMNLSIRAQAVNQ